MTIRAELRRWRVRPAVGVFLAVAPFAGAAALAPLSGSRLFRFLIREDSAIEWLQVVGYAAAFVFATLLAVRLWRRGQRLIGAAYAALAIGCLFIMGEELSWGQRLFGLDTPAPLAEVNRRGEINVHNVPAVTNAFRVVVLAVGIYGSIAAAAVRLTRTVTETVELLFPPLFLSGFFLAVLAYTCARIAVNPGGYFDAEPRLVLVGLAEWMELCVALGLALFTTLGWRRLRRQQPPGLV